MWKFIRNKYEISHIKGNDLFSADQIEGIELSGGEDEEFGDEIL